MHRIHQKSAVTSASLSFDLLVRDFNSINLRQHRARNFLLHYHARRAFCAGSTEPPRLFVEANELGDKRWRDEGVGLKITGYKDEDGVKVGDTMPLELGEGGEQWNKDGWTAEVDVVAPEGHVAAMPGGSVVTETGTVPAAVGDATAVSVDPAAAAVAGHSAADGTRSRAESRLARRQRRELAGNYKPDAAARQQQNGNEAGEDGRDSVLSMIEKMDGPALFMSKDKTAKPAHSKDGEAKREEKDGVKTQATKRIERLLKLKDQNSKARAAQAEDRPKRENWQIQKSAIQSKFGDSTWQPRKRLSPDTLEGIRALHASDPVTYSTETLSSQFAVSAENIRRILKSKWRPNDDEREEREKRWERRGVRKWTEMAELGERPPRRWREMGVGSVKGEPERKPGWKKGGRKDYDEAEDIEWMSDEFGERIL